MYVFINTPKITSKEFEMNQDKYGFVYIWYDKKHKRYYIGCRWGNENDGYICSSTWMKRGFKIRPKDFKRRILSRIYSNKKELLEEEYRWLSMISDTELGHKYYNLHNHHFGHWSTDENKKLTVGEKISNSHKNNPNWGQWSKNKKMSDETKEKLRAANRNQFENDKNKEAHCEKSRNLWKNPEYRNKVISSQKNKKLTEEHKNNIKMANVGKKRKYTNIKCPHCDVAGRKNNMKRYHFDNCKKKQTDKGIF
jgi:hypothetical protein